MGMQPMEMRPPWTKIVTPQFIRSQKTERRTYDVVVLTADDVRAARVATAEADDGNGGAVQTKERVDAVDDNAEKAKDQAKYGVTGLRG